MAVQRLSPQLAVIAGVLGAACNGGAVDSDSASSTASATAPTGAQTATDPPTSDSADAASASDATSDSGSASDSASGSSGSSTGPNAKFDLAIPDGGETGGNPGECGCGLSKEYSYIWIANAEEGTVSKINT
ncbi:MAG: hypothetical protein KC486_03150, partial [Myxococcales bacterium]|nr:hypothetical protein [Myxococcales bacterium]